MKHNLSDITFLIPLRVDSIFRLENLLLTVGYLQDNFECHIKIIEADQYSNGLVSRMLSNVDYTFIKDLDPIFHRTKYQNLLALKADTPYIAIWESEIIIPPHQVLDAACQLRCDNAEIAFPYDGKALDTSFLLREYYLKQPDIEFLNRHAGKMNILYNRIDLVGGAILLKRDAYIQSGMDDESYYGWGNEDFERKARWDILGYRIFRSAGHLYHLSHSRGDNSKYPSKFYSDTSLSNLAACKTFSKHEMLEKIK